MSVTNLMMTLSIVETNEGKQVVPEANFETQPKVDPWNEFGYKTISEILTCTQVYVLHYLLSFMIYNIFFILTFVYSQRIPNTVLIRIE